MNYQLEKLFFIGSKADIGDDAPLKQLLSQEEKKQLQEKEKEKKKLELEVQKIKKMKEREEERARKKDEQRKVRSFLEIVVPPSLHKKVLFKFLPPLYLHLFLEFLQQKKTS